MYYDPYLTRNNDLKNRQIVVNVLFCLSSACVLISQPFLKMNSTAMSSFTLLGSDSLSLMALSKFAVVDGYMS